MNGNDKATELLRTLTERVATLKDTNEWRAWLDFAAKFHDYSFRNQLLILIQRPNATRVAGFKAWLSVGRCVRKGETGIAILAPCVRIIDDRDTNERRSVLTGFKVVYVFDLAQTDGAPLPTLTMPDVNVASEDLYERLMLVAMRKGIAVNVIPESTNGARGWFSPHEQSITIVEGAYSIGSRTRTLLHELGHAFDHEVTGLDDIGSRAERELVAESVAYIVGTTQGIDMADASTFYVASWTSKRDDLQRIAQRVLAVAARLQEELSGIDVESRAA